MAVPINGREPLNGLEPLNDCIGSFYVPYGIEPLNGRPHKGATGIGPIDLSEPGVQTGNFSSRI